jgi:hypothetical protein
LYYDLYIVQARLNIENLWMLFNDYGSLIADIVHCFPWGPIARNVPFMAWAAFYPVAIFVVQTFLSASERNAGRKTRSTRYWLSAREQLPRNNLYPVI